MKDHEKGSPKSRSLCDSILTAIQELRPTVARTALGRWCAFHEAGNNRFAYLNHAPKGPGVIVFFRSDPEMTLSSPPETEVKKRGKISGGWSLIFPYSIKEALTKPLEKRGNLGKHPVLLGPLRPQNSAHQVQWRNSCRGFPAHSP